MTAPFIHAMLLAIASGAFSINAIPSKPLVTAWTSCQQGADEFGVYTYCTSGSTYELRYSSGIYVSGNCNRSYAKHPKLSDSVAGAFHAQVCGASGAIQASPSNIYDVLKEILKPRQYY